MRRGLWVRRVAGAVEVLVEVELGRVVWVEGRWRRRREWWWVSFWGWRWWMWKMEDREAARRPQSVFVVIAWVVEERGVESAEAETFS